MKIKYLLTALFALAVAGVNSAEGQVNDSIAFGDKEKLTYVISYKVLGVTVDIANVIFEVSSEKVDSADTYHINAVGSVLPGYRWFFDMRDEYNTWLDRTTLKPVKFSNNIKEGSYRYMSSMTYNWKNMTVDTWARNLKRENADTKQMTLTDNSFDGLALFYTLRNTPLENITDGFYGYIEMVSASKITKLKYTFLGREVKSIPQMGRYNTLKFSCQLSDDDGEAFPDGSEFLIWLSDDSNKIPLYLESPIRVGSVKGRLARSQNLKYPLNKVN